MSSYYREIIKSLAMFVLSLSFLLLFLFVFLAFSVFLLTSVFVSLSFVSFRSSYGPPTLLTTTSPTYRDRGSKGLDSVSGVPTFGLATHPFPSGEDGQSRRLNPRTLSPGEDEEGQPF